VSVAAAVGLVLATAAALILEYLDDTIKNKEGVERMLNLPALGVIGRMRAVHEPADRLVTMRDRTSAIAEAYRVVATNVQYARLRKAPGSLLVTSPGSREGKSTTLCNLGIALAQTGKRVIICDADLRRPSVHRYFGVGHEVGLTSLLLEERLPIEQALSQTQVPGLQILPSGPVPPNPVQLLASEPMRERLAELKQHCDVLLFDSPAAGSVADASILGALCDGVIVVVDARRTRSDAARQVVADLQQVRLTLLGVILNRARMRSHSIYFGQRHLPAPRASSRVGALLGGLLGGQR
jgi:non-specific protein-tyrosine kinase